MLASALIAFALANVAVLVAGSAFHIRFDRLASLEPGQIAILTIAQDVTLAVCLLALLRRWARLGPAALGMDRPVFAGAGVAAGAVLWLVSAALERAQTAVFGAQPQSLVLAAAAHRDPGSLALDLFFGVGIVAVVEELFFRAVIFSLLRQRMSFLSAAAASSAVFAVAHEIGVWLPVFVLGMGLAYLYERRHSLWANAVAHGTVNAVSFLLLFLLPPD